MLYVNKLNTVTTLKKRSGFIWQLAQGVVAALILGLCTWVLSTVEDLQVKVASIESSGKENMAQWKALTDLSEKVKKNEIEVIIGQRMFQMLLDQNGIQIRIKKDPIRKKTSEGESIEEFQEIHKELPTVSRKDRIDVFKEEQIREFTRQYMQQRMPTEIK